MEYVNLGSSGLQVSRICLGCMSFGAPDRGSHEWSLDEDASRPFLRRAVEAGITFFDTANVYSAGSSEEIVGRALADYARRDEIVLATKVHGTMRPGPNGGGLSRKAILAEIDASLSRLGTDYVDLYQPARVDPAVPIEDTVGAIAELVQAGYVRHIGLSEAGADTIRRANAVHPIAALQIEYSLLTRSIEAEILPTVRELGIAVTAYGVLSRGLLTGGFQPGQPRDPRDFRTASSPRFQGENLAKNLTLAGALAHVAAEKGATPAQLAIAWVLSRGEDIIPLVGARMRDRLAESLGALDLHLTTDDLARIEAAIPPGAAAGERYPAAQMAHLDSERSHTAS